MTLPTVSTPHFTDEFYTWSIAQSHRFNTDKSLIVDNKSASEDPDLAGSTFFGAIKIEQGGYGCVSLNHMPLHILRASLTNFRLFVARDSKVRIGIFKEQKFTEENECSNGNSFISVGSSYNVGEHDILSDEAPGFVSVDVCYNNQEVLIAINGKERIITRLENSKLQPSVLYTVGVYCETGKAVIDSVSFGSVSGANPIFKGYAITSAIPNFRAFIAKDDVAITTPYQTPEFGLDKIVCIPVSVGKITTTSASETETTVKVVTGVTATVNVTNSADMSIEASLSKVPGDFGASGTAVKTTGQSVSLSIGQSNGISLQDDDRFFLNVRYHSQGADTKDAVSVSVKTDINSTTTITPIAPADTTLSA